MTYSFIAIQSAFCVTFTYPNGSQMCTLHNNWLPSLVTSLPAWVRFVQCLRRYYDNRNIHPHLTNAAKYVLSLAAIIFSIGSRLNDSIALTSLWMIFSGFASVYAYLWDVMFDWGLFAKNSEHRFLRKEITYPPWFYYFSIM
jgi:xenotropic and polytropic retrovirus receptor 1